MWRNTSPLLCQKSPVHFKGKWHVTGPCKMNDYILHQRGNTDKTWVYFYMPFNYTVGDTGAKHVVIKPSGNGCVLHVCMYVRINSNFWHTQHGTSGILIERERECSAQYKLGFKTQCQPWRVKLIKVFMQGLNFVFHLCIIFKFSICT